MGKGRDIRWVHHRNDQSTLQGSLDRGPVEVRVGVSVSDAVAVLDGVREAVRVPGGRTCSQSKWMGL